MNGSLLGLRGQSTVQITREGVYVAPSGKRVVLGAITPSVQMAATATYEAKLGSYDTVIEVTKESTLEAIRRLGGGTVALNFASATNPGGGFLRGSVAQEESLARSSTLYRTLVGHTFYDLHRGMSGLYSDCMIYSPIVEIFRADEGFLLEEPYSASIITSAAVNKGYLSGAEHMTVPAVMSQRAFKVLGLAAYKGHTKLVLGAWGCGVFGNDPGMVARIFANHLSTSFRGTFAHVVFAIYRGGGAYSEFRRVL